jgi:hypothetical protein
MRERQPSISAFSGKWDTTTALEILEFMRGRRGQNGLIVVVDEAEGYLGFRDGDVICARTPKSEGIRALADLLSWDGEFYAAAFREEDANINKPGPEAIFEALGIHESEIRDSKDIPIDVDWGDDSDGMGLDILDRATAQVLAIDESNPVLEPTPSPKPHLTRTTVSEPRVSRPDLVQAAERKPEFHAKPTVAAMPALDPATIRRELEKRAAQAAKKRESIAPSSTSGPQTLRGEPEEESAPDSGATRVHVDPKVPSKAYRHDSATKVYATPTGAPSEDASEERPPDSAATRTHVVASKIPNKAYRHDSPTKVAVVPDFGPPIAKQAPKVPPGKPMSLPPIVQHRPSPVTAMPAITPLALPPVALAQAPAPLAPRLSRDSLTMRSMRSPKEQLSDRILRASSSMVTVPGVQFLAVIDLSDNRILGTKVSASATKISPESVEPSVARWAAAEGPFLNELDALYRSLQHQVSQASTTMDEIVTFTSQNAHIVRPWHGLAVYICCERDVNLGIARIRLQNTLRALAPASTPT